MNKIDEKSIVVNSDYLHSLEYKAEKYDELNNTIPMWVDKAEEEAPRNPVDRVKRLIQENAELQNENERLNAEKKILVDGFRILDRHLYVVSELVELRMATPKNADFLIENCNWRKYYNGLDVRENECYKFVKSYLKEIKPMLEIVEGKK